MCLINIDDCAFMRSHTDTGNLSLFFQSSCHYDFNFVAIGLSIRKCFQKEVPSKDSVGRPFPANAPTEILTFMKRIISAACPGTMKPRMHFYGMVESIRK